MTNRKWLSCLSNEELARLINDSDNCDYCIRNLNGDCDNVYCDSSEYCEGGIVEWLNAKHGNLIPKLKVGDILRFKLGNDNKVYTATVIAEGCMYSLDSGYGLLSTSDSYYRIVEIQRFNGEILETIWRDDND